MKNNKKHKWEIESVLLKLNKILRLGGELRMELKRKQGNCNHMLQEATGLVLISIESCMKRFLTQDPAGHTKK